MDFDNFDNSVKGYYVHGKKLGEGGFGVVRMATHLITRQKVAIKIINKVKVGKDLFRVKTEIEALKILQHDNIAKLLQVIEDSINIYLVMEYCSGGELFDYLLSKRHLSETESRRFIISLLNVLSYVHGKGFAHRDIKPENILLDEKSNIKLIDFGLAANSGSAGSLECLSTCCGSPAYVAPELLEGRKYSGPAVDVWSTGVLLYTILTGNLPFNDNNTKALYRKIKAGDFTMPLFFNRNLKDLLRKMLATDPKMRITIPQIMEHPWIKPYRMKIEPKVENSTNEIQVNDQILLKCAALLVNDDLNDIRNKIIKNYGYETATYWLTYFNPEQFKDLEILSRKEMINRRRSRSSSELTSPYVSDLLRKRKEVKYGENVDPTASKFANTDMKVKVQTRLFHPPTNSIRKPAIVRNLFPTVGTSENPSNRKILVSKDPNVDTPTKFSSIESPKPPLPEVTPTKNFTIRCSLNSMNIVAVAFELELMVCRQTGLIGIFHQRLRGNSWDYFKLCEELLKI
ncbi:hypothetical protein BLOT_015003 [Blomia tropicalis]|nr:hypothetical protein BLOT_015003 [Blomia tropicalis]